MWFYYKKYISLSLLLISLLVNCTQAQEYAGFSYLGIENGLSNNSVRCIYQDHNGFMWFGTYDGLNCYDGYTFKIFRNKSNDTTSLPHNYINTIGEDQHNNIWIGTGQGMSMYNPFNSGFVPGLFIPDGGSQKLRIAFNINLIRTNAKGNMFIGTNGGGLLIKPEGHDAAIQLPCIKDSNGICRNDIQGLEIDTRQRVWLFVREWGLGLYDETTGRIQLINGELKTANSMITDDSDNVWIGTDNGLHKFNTSTKSFETPAIKPFIGFVGSLSFDRQHNLWIGTLGSGLVIFNIKNGKVNQLLPGNNRHSLSSEDVSAIYEDKESRKWIGTLKGGIDIIDPQKNKFQTISKDPLAGNSLVSNFVLSFNIDKNQNLWIGTDGGGLSVWNRKQNSFINYRHQPGNPHSLSHNVVPAICEDFSGNLWVATFGDGINKLDKATGTFEHYSCINDFTGEVEKFVWLIFEDRERNLWATTFGNGKLYRFNRQANRFEIFNHDPVDIYSIAEDHTGTLWAGTTYGMFKVDRENKKYIYYQIPKPVRSILEDKKGRLWIGTEGVGLNLFDKTKGQVVASFTDADGLCNNAVLNILEDDKGHLWLSTFHGLSMFDPVTKNFKNYYQEDGLQSNQFSYNAAIRLQSGELVFGGIKGFNVFNPNTIQPRNYSPAVLMTGLRINNRDVSAESSYITALTNDKITALTIPFKDAALSFDFAALEYSAPGKITYAYYLEGWDKGWNYSGNLRTANYTKLSEGNYTLHIKATNAEGVWNPKEVSLKIKVLPPWFRSWWAYALYILLALVAVVFYQRYRSKQAAMEYEIKLAKLNAAKEKAERETEQIINGQEKAMNEKRLDFFTDISHEFRTPLTLVINPLKDILQNARKEANIDPNELSIVYRNARRLLSLVDQLLLFRKTDTGADDLKITKLNFSSLCKDVYLAFVQQARALDITYNFECEDDEIQLYADRDKMEIVLYNLVSNAMKYTSKGGRITLAITETDNIKVTVSDNGYGITKEVGDKLFERFYQVKDKSIPSSAGFGIGLYLVKYFVESHYGTVSYESEPGKGTSFLVQLQKGKDHFEQHPVYEELPMDAMAPSALLDTEIIATNISSKGRKAKLEPLITEKQSILIVDDDRQMCSYMGQIFDGQYTVYLAESGEEGIKLACQYLPDIIISDVKMPGINGFDFCKMVKEDVTLNHIPLVLVTGESSLEKRLEGVEGGADDYITKPFEKELLVAKVAGILKSRNNLQSYFYNEITLQENPLKISEEYKAFLEKCMVVVEKYLDDENFNVKVLAAELNMSHSSLYKKIKSISGQSANAFIRFIRLRKAAEILINTDSNINETAAQVGINSVKYFRQNFTKVFGITPSEYIKRYRKTFGKLYNLDESGYKDEN